MIPEILCTTDFSDSSNAALRWSIDLARKLGAHLTVLYTYRLLKQNGEVVMMKKVIEDQAARNFGALEQALLVGAGVAYDFRAEIGFVSDRVGEHAKKQGIAFLVMGEMMTTGNREIFEELVENLQVPLVIVPESWT